ncbi:murein L,D-transpeptidase YcbB/YkuD [Aliiruegeria haliotis]|uniref:Murein L,D-transpeptidase YcbB/YkuD n=1 Tax=Aliiruegeria haliotis TaxID=1280846 RepID=A0A2T0RN49_9RHOB|nr:L,D-transpeptidase family protein [Aliiruegeria haliotis]PRY22614.1 murein L,D-transpeptidase YcbB/YkuD [Aliiruegeria haliotis]
MRWIRACLLATSVTAAAAGGLSPASAQTEAAQITAALEALPSGVAEVGGVRIVATDFIRDFYALRDGRVAWFDTPAADSLLTEMTQALTQGFLPPDFHLPRLFDLHEAAINGGPAEVATFEIVATDAAARLIHFMVFGKVDPAAMDAAWNFERPVIEADPVAVVNKALEAGGFSELMGELAIRDEQYLLLVEALRTYREIEAAGGWPQVPEGAPLKVGMDDPRVPTLLERLAVEGDFEGIETEDTTYSTAVQLAVVRYQRRHGLEADGVVGPRTLASLNAPVTDRIDKLRLSLERFRWFVRGLEDDFVLVNIAGARTFLVLDGQLAWTTRSITGSAYRQTPVFRDDITYMEFNPTWTVPNSIFVKDKLERIRKDSGYLERNNYIVRDRASGKIVSASSVNWGASNPGVALVQQPGPNNALGLVKFMFPNKHAVYLHDTNDRSLFDRDTRNLSSGCVRIENPFVFAGLLMQEDPSWTQGRMDEILASGKTTRVDLPRPMPVLLTYWTAWVEDDVVHFREDPYERDGRVLKALNAAF